MDAKLKEEWVKALRSGEYEQARGSLQENGKYCCLGVLNRVAGRPMKYGFSDVDTIGFSSSVEQNLVKMNDCHPWNTFSQIADYIEANL